MEIQKIYFDMDGVLADFEKGVKDLCGLTILNDGEIRSKEDDEFMWEKIRKCPSFYNKLDFVPGMKEIFQSFLQKFGEEKIEILTGIPKPERGITTAKRDKIAWTHRFLGENIKVNTVLRKDKPNFCKGREYILIDDLRENISMWESAGGIGVLFRNTQDLINHPIFSSYF